MQHETRAYVQYSEARAMAALHVLRGTTPLQESGGCSTDG